MRKKLTIGAILLFLAGAGIISMDRYFKYCEGHPNDSACPSVEPSPSPSPLPTVTPTPIPSPSPTSTPTPSPTPVSCTVPSSNDPTWTVQSPQPSSEKRDIVITATNNIGDRCGQNPDESLMLLASELNRLGECADKWADSVLIKRSAQFQGQVTWEQRHVVGYGDGCWRTGDGPNVYEGVWIYGYTSEFNCPDPRPLRVFSDTGNPHYRLDCKPLGTLIDCTLVYLDTWDPSSASCPYCTAIGMGTIGGTPRCTCPTRPPGNAYEVGCNDYLSDGKLFLESRNGVNCIRVDDTKFEPNNGNCRLRNNANTVFGGWF